MSAPFAFNFTEGEAGHAAKVDCDGAQGEREKEEEEEDEFRGGETEYVEYEPAQEEQFRRPEREITFEEVEVIDGVTLHKVG